MVVRARAPASTSNLGPGFDAFGAALTVGLVATVTDEPPSGDKNLAERAAELITGRPVEHAIEIRSDIPVGRGLGSSGACVAAGLLIGCALAGRSEDPAELLRAGAALEGHPDNLAAALYGGLVVALPGGSVVPLGADASVRPLILVPDERLATAEARRVLPQQVPMHDAVANVAAAAGLVAVLTGRAEATPERLLACTEDRLHQSYRAALMPKTADALSELRTAGVAAAVSGAGPSIVCLSPPGREDFVRAAAGNLETWQLLELDWDSTGARLEGE